MDACVNAQPGEEQKGVCSAGARPRQLRCQPLVTQRVEISQTDQNQVCLGTFAHFRMETTSVLHKSDREPSP